MNKKQLEDLRTLLACIIFDLHFLGNGDARTQQLLDNLTEIMSEAKDDAR